MNSVAVAYKKGFRNSLHFFDADDPKASVAKMREHAPTVVYAETAALIGVPISILAGIIHGISWKLRLKPLKGTANTFNEFNENVRNIHERVAQASREFVNGFSKH